MGKRWAYRAAGLVAVGWVFALAGEVFTVGTPAGRAWRESRRVAADRDDAGTLTRLRAGSWAGYVGLAVLGGYTGYALAGLPRANQRRGELRAGVVALGAVGLTAAAVRLWGDFDWRLWAVVPGDLASAAGYGLAVAVGLGAVPSHIVRRVGPAGPAAPPAADPAGQ